MPIAIVDIDGTVITFGGRPRDEVIAQLNAFDGDRVVVTGREEQERAATNAELRAAGLNYDGLMMNPGIDTIDHKRETAAVLLKAQDVAFAVDDDPAARRAYESLGITAVAPGDLASILRGANMGKTETRAIQIADFEIRDQSDGMSFSGYAAVFDSPSQPLPFIETIAAGAFSRTLRSRNNVRMLLNHDTSRVLATTRSGTMRLSEDSKGLHVDARLPETSYGKDTAIALRDGLVDSMSFGFTVPSKGDQWSEDGTQRILREVRLHEVSVVTFPAYEATTASVRDYSALALRTSVDVDELAMALEQMAAGQVLTTEQVRMLMDVISSLAQEEDVVAESNAATIPVALLQKQLDLAAKAV